MATDRSDTFRSDTFADLLRRYRRALGLSQEKLAEKAGLSRRGVSDLERGLKQTPHTYTVDQLAHALGISGAEHVSFQAAARPRKQVMRNDPILLPSPADRARPPLVGRSGELALLDRHLAHVGPLLLLLAGEPGIGKSRLLQEAGERAAAAGWRVLRGGCQRRSAQAPYEPIVDALARHTMSRRARQLRSDLKGAHWLALLLPELAEQAVVPRPQWHLPPEQERRLMFAAVGRFLENVAGTAGTLLVLDDLQWAGVDALELLGTLLRQERDAPLRMVGTYRETEVRPLDPLTRFVADTVGEGIALRKQVRPLRETDAHALLAALLTEEEGSDAALCERIVRRSGGVPLFLVSYARGLQSGALHGQSETGEEIPWDLRQNVRQRVLALPEPTQRLLGVAAIAGREASLGLLAAASGHGEEELLAALEAADHARLLVASDGQTYRFVHDVIREVVEEDLSPMRRRVLHQKVAEALEQHSQHVPDRNPADLAFHFQEAGEPARALPYVMLAGDRAEQTHAYTEAERQYELSAELAHTVRNRAREVEAQRKRALVLMHHARYGDALEILERVVSYLQVVGDLDGELRAVAAMLEIHGNQGTVARGLVLAERLLAQIHPQPLPGAVPTNSTGGPALSAQGLADFYIGLAALYFYGGRYREELCAAEEAVQQARAAWG